MNYYRTSTSHYARCRTLMIRFRYRQKIRFLLTGVILFANCYFHVITLPVVYYQEYDRIYGLLWGWFGYLINLIIGITAFCVSTERLKLLIMLLILIGLSAVIGFVHSYAGIALGGIFLTQLPECIRMRWIREQQGYPYFNERYQRQEDYQKITAELIEKFEHPEQNNPNQPEIIIFSMRDEEEK